MPPPFHLSAESIDLAPRVVRSATVTGSPAAAAETIVCTTPALGDLAFGLGVLLIGWFSCTIGTNGVSVTVKLRRTDASGSTVTASGALTAVAADLRAFSISGFDTGPTLPGQVYVMTATVGSGSAASTVSAATLIAVCI